VQLSEYVVSCVIGPTLCDPLVASVPVQPPDAVHELTLAPVHVNIDVALRATPVGFAVRLTDGVTAVTVTVALSDALPPVPVHDSV
jgi:hypothetical protein